MKGRGLGGFLFFKGVFSFTIIFSPLARAQLHPEGHHAQGYEVVVIVDKAIRYQGAQTRQEVLSQRGQLVSPSGQTVSVFTLDPENQAGQRHWRLEAVWDTSTGKELMYRTKKRVPLRNEHGQTEWRWQETTAQAATRTGFYPVKVLARNYVSRAYGEKMPFSVGYDPDFGVYIHATTQERCDQYIGTRKSAGCTRLCAEEAEYLFGLVREKGRGLVLSYHPETGAPLRNRQTGDYLYVNRFRTLVINTDSTPAPLREKPLPAVANWRVLSLDPIRYQQNPNQLFELIQGAWM